MQSFNFQASRCVHTASTVWGGQAFVDGGSWWDRAHVSLVIFGKSPPLLLFGRYAHTPGGKPSNANQTFLDESGFSFVQDCLAGLENRGLEDQGMYRVVGVGSKVTTNMKKWIRQFINLTCLTFQYKVPCWLSKSLGDKAVDNGSGSAESKSTESGRCYWVGDQDHHLCCENFLQESAR